MQWFTKCVGWISANLERNIYLKTYLEHWPEFQQSLKGYHLLLIHCTERFLSSDLSGAKKTPKESQPSPCR